MIKQKKSKKFIYILIFSVILLVLLGVFLDVPVEQSVVKESVSVRVQ